MSECLHEPVVHAALVLGEEHTSELQPAAWRVRRFLARISPVVKFATGRAGGFFRGETRAAPISFPRERQSKRSRMREANAKRASAS